MLIPRLAARNLARQPRRSLLIVVLVAASVGVLFFSDSVVASSTEGLDASLRGELTGDLVLGSTRGAVTGLFGSELPIVSDYETIPPLDDYASLVRALEGIPSLDSFAPLVSAPARLEVEGVRILVPVLGVEPESYAAVFDAGRRGFDPEAMTPPGSVALSEELAAEVERGLGRPLNSGEELTFASASGVSFRIRRGTYRGRLAFSGRTEVFKRLVIAEASLARALVDYSQGSASAQSGGEAAEQGFDLDALFDAAEDAVADSADGTSAAKVEEELKDTSSRDAAVAVDSAAWSFVALRAKPGRSAELRRGFEASGSEGGRQARVLSWRTAAGGSVGILFALQASLYAGMGFLLFGVLLVISNVLVIAVLERRAEIGAMRGLGASRAFISRLFLTESLFLTGLGALVGLALGSAAALLAAREGIPLPNSVLKGLFGADRAFPVLRGSSLLWHFLGALGAGALAWIYPVSAAVRVQPAKALGGGL